MAKVLPRSATGARVTKPTSPSKAERMAARKVLVYYEKIVRKLQDKNEDDEQMSEWQRGAEVWIDLLRRDPEAEIQNICTDDED